MIRGLITTHRLRLLVGSAVLVSCVLLWIVFFQTTIYLKSQVYYTPLNGASLTAPVTSMPLDELRTNGSPRGRCKWPPDSVEQLYDSNTDKYDLALRPCLTDKLMSHVDPCSTDLFKRLKSLYRGAPLRDKSCLRQLVLMDAKLRMNSDEPNYSLYPQMGDIRALVVAIRTGQAVHTRPVNDPPLRIIRKPRTVCDGTSSAYSYDLIVIVKTCVTCTAKRENARKTYMKHDLWTPYTVQFVFVVGMPSTNHSEWLFFDGVRVRNPTSKPKHPEILQQALLNESDHYGDLLIGDFIDSYYNLTYKQVTTFRWASAFCRHTSPLYFFVDDDYSLVPSNVVKMLRKIPDHLKVNMNGGTLGPMRSVLRPTDPNNAGRWTISEDEIPWSQYPQYSSGSAYVVGAQLVTDAAIAMAYTRFFRFDDAYLGFVWDKLHVPVMTIHGMRHSAINSSNFVDVVSVKSSEADKLVDWSTGTVIKK